MKYLLYATKCLNFRYLDSILENENEFLCLILTILSKLEQYLPVIPLPGCPLGELIIPPPPGPPPTGDDIGSEIAGEPGIPP